MLDLGEALFTLLPRQGITGCKHKAYEQHVLLENRRKIEGFWTLASSICINMCILSIEDCLKDLGHRLQA